MKVHIRHIVLNQHMIECDWCHSLFPEASTLWHEANETQHVCDCCYCSHTDTFYVGVIGGEPECIHKYQRFHVRIGENGKPYRYYLNPPLLLETIPKE